ncbi:g-protein coupled receptor [Holotrichia oblita]|uniref:G-protein coupled receptor n=1 Tax=Holotrichia oblita TaxID=644536 RepID=A0ACB9SYY9_HOLOL|nr:g-protein coupled receptor [Holotrichia oblita]
MFPVIAIVQATAYSFNNRALGTLEWTSSLVLEQNTSSVEISVHPTSPRQGFQFQYQYEVTAVQATRSTNISGHNSDWGPKRDPLYIVIPITVIYAFIFFAGVVGNIGTCIVIARNKCMHTATNYYLFSLAVSDLLLLISGLPPEIYSIWSKYPYIFGEAFCVLQGFAAETSANATVLTITAFTIERYVAICHPFLSHTLSKLSRAIKFIIGIWLVAMSLAIPQAISFGIIYEISPDGRTINDDHYMCNVKRVIIPHAFEISTLLFFVAPMSMITVLYILIGLQLHKSTSVGPCRSRSVKLKLKVCRQSVAFANNSTQAILIINGSGENEIEKQAEEEGRRNYSRNAQATKHVVKMLVAVVVAFFICWAPFHAQRLLAIYGQPTTANMITAFRILTYISGILYFLSTTINPLLYHIMSHRFREAFKVIFSIFL